MNTSQRVWPDSMARVAAYAATVIISVSRASGSSNRKMSVATGVTASTAPAMRAAPGPNQRRTVVYSTVTAAMPSSACGTSRLQ